MKKTSAAASSAKEEVSEQARMQDNFWPEADPDPFTVFLFQAKPSTAKVNIVHT